MKKIVTTIALLAACALPVSASAASCPTITSDLKSGSKGAQVTALQVFLKSQGYFKATSVPNYGAATQAAVKAFQKANKISQTGTVGPLTRAKIKSLCSAASSSSGSVSSTVDPTGITPTDAPTQFEVTGWIPYWRQATGTADTLANLNKLTEVNPFVYTLKSDGTLMDNGPLDGEPWASFDAIAKAQGVRVIPTIMTSNAALVHQLLSNDDSRRKLEDDIAAIATQKGFDGVDIDFEGKSSNTKDYFSTFLKGLKQRLGSKWLMCTIETRIPNEDKYYGTEIPADAGVFANDLKAIGTYCDRVRLMTYDQQGIDLKLQADAGTRLYAANGDPAWIEKVVNLMSKDIPKSKILIGVPTYGYEYSVTTYEGGQHLYDILWTFNPGYAAPQKGISQQSLAEKYGITPERQYWGELGFTYVPVSDNATSSLISANSGSGIPALAASAAAATYANTYKSHLSYRYVVWPDEVSTLQKVELAKRLGVRGISIFKLDGGQDPDIWNVLTGIKK
jgi:spore germination protein YaaH